MRFARAFWAVFALALVWAPAARAQAPPPADQAALMAPALEAHTLALDREGYALAAGPITGAFAPGGAETASVRLWAGQDYKIAGVCAERCGGIVLRVRDPDGVVIGESRGEALQVRPSATGRHVIDVRAARCGGPRCWFALNIYAR